MSYTINKSKNTGSSEEGSLCTGGGGCTQATKKVACVREGAAVHRLRRR